MENLNAPANAKNIAAVTATAPPNLTAQTKQTNFTAQSKNNAPDQISGS